jgi:hypothetical protein
MDRAAVALREHDRRALQAISRRLCAAKMLWVARIITVARTLTLNLPPNLAINSCSAANTLSPLGGRARGKRAKEKGRNSDSGSEMCWCLFHAAARRHRFFLLKRVENRKPPLAGTDARLQFTRALHFIHRRECASSAGVDFFTYCERIFNWQNSELSACVWRV